MFWLPVSTLMQFCNNQDQSEVLYDWDKDELMHYWKEKCEKINHLLNKEIGRRTMLLRTLKGKSVMVANSAKNKSQKYGSIN